MKLSRHLAIFQALIIIFYTFGFSKTFAEERSGSIQETAENASDPLSLSLVPFASGFSGPLGAIGAEDGRIFVLEQNGVIKTIQSDGTVLATPFLDIQTRVDSSSNEEGLLGMALDPDFDSNGFFYLNYTHTDTNRISRISRFGLTADPNVADPASEEVLLTIDQPASNHNAGGILFGPDGYLYIPMGDGGGSPGTRPQDLSLLLGKVIRIDVSRQPGNGTGDCEGAGTGNYAIPADNPFVDGSGVNCDEIWALGLRNPWQSSFDRTTGDLYIGDVGQNAREEINFQPASSSGGENYGWPCYEGNSPYNTDGCVPSGNYDFPIFDYAHFSTSCTSVTGGYVYRGTQFPDMFGHYIFTDYCQGVFWDLAPDGSGGWNSTEHTNLTGFGYSAFGQDSDGELYVTHIGNGTLYHLQEENSPPPPPPSDSVCVEGIELNLLSLKSNRGAQADISVTDCTGNPVVDVVVSGLWETPTSSSPLNAPDSTTDNLGIATSISPTVRKKDSGQFIYYVSSVEKSGLTYDSENSVESACINTDGSLCTAEPPPPPPPPGSEAHLGDLGGGSSSSSGSKWNALVTVTVHKDPHEPYPNVTVNGNWSNGARGSGSCQTGGDGVCSITKNNIKGRTGNVTFTVNDISDASGSIYNSSANDVISPSIIIEKPASSPSYRMKR